MIRVNIFKMTLDNGRVAFNSAIIERHNGNTKNNNIDKIELINE